MLWMSFGDGGSLPFTVGLLRGRMLSLGEGHGVLDVQRCSWHMWGQGGGAGWDPYFLSCITSIFKRGDTGQSRAEQCRGHGGVPANGIGLACTPAPCQNLPEPRYAPGRC